MSLLQSKTSSYFVINNNLEKNQEIKKEISQFLLCGICNKKYIDPKICPKCNRIYCNSCFRLIGLIDKKVKCPLCKIESKPKNYIKMRNLESIAKNIRNVFINYNNNLCPIHQEDQMIHYCIDCKKKLCGTCIISGSHKEHKLVNYEAYQTINQKLKEINIIKVKEELMDDKQKLNKIKEAKKTLNDFLDDLKRNVEEKTQNIEDYLNKSIDTLNQINLEYNNLKEALDNLSNLQYNFINHKKIIELISSKKSEKEKEKEYLKDIDLFNIKPENFFYKSECYEELTQRNLLTINYINSILKINAKFDKIKLFCEGCIKTPDLNYEGFINKDGKFDIKGKISYLNQSFNNKEYFGEFFDGIKNGFGVLLSKDGDKYIGEFKNDKKQGYGNLLYYNGSKYIGDFYKDKQQGQGINIYKSELFGHIINNN